MQWPTTHKPTENEQTITNKQKTRKQSTHAIEARVMSNTTLQSHAKQAYKHKQTKPQKQNTSVIYTHTSNMERNLATYKGKRIRNHTQHEQTRANNQ